MKLNDAGIALIKKCEGLKLTPYRDIGGKITVGYGHTGKDIELKKRYTQKECDDFLLADLKVADAAVRKLLTVKLNDNQFSALVSFVYNLGATNFQVSELRKRLNAGENPYIVACSELPRWRFFTKDNVKVESEGLLNRRLNEIELFINREVI